METLIPVFLIVTLLLILIAIKIFNIANTKKPNAKNKHDLNNNSKTIDTNESYIDSIWEEMRKN